ncbi:AraC family transcriptional regulator [Malaciobacter mytili]|uniref:AraC family transcriptional regulator n=1 Tax=Malaciobacter mytili TaxID=603050 RepID=UPI00100BFFDF|nr:AraC family transcriptional regulator [Malaciobacter mytili]RXI37146.1 AraC family transcriptional regulator [Malaciobacter mytili]
MENLIHNISYIKPSKEKEIFLYEGHFNNFNFEKHVHEEYTISIIEKGSMKAFFNGFNHKLDKSSIITINPDEVHSCGILNKEGYKHHSLYINPSVMKNILKENFNSELLSFKDVFFNNNMLYNKLAYFIRLDKAKIDLDLVWECQFVNLLEDILKLNTKVSSNIKPIAKNSYLIKQAKEFINDNFHQNLTLDDLSKEFNISKYHFLRLFKEQTFVSPHTYLILRRIEKAKQLLREGFSIIDTSYICGFNDQSHLNRRFKSITGLTPGKYKSFF